MIKIDQTVSKGFIFRRYQTSIEKRILTLYPPRPPIADPEELLIK